VTPEVPAGRPRPVPDRDSRPWWAALARHELVLQACGQCGAWRWPPRALCNRCGSLAWEWKAASGRGAVASWIVNHHGFSDAFGSPYVVVLVRLDEQDDLLLPGSWSGAPDGHGLRIDLPVAAAFEDVAGDGGRDAVTLLGWRPRT
jgi:uncharacterized OB-fold protein